MSTSPRSMHLKKLLAALLLSLPVPALPVFAEAPDPAIERNALEIQDGFDLQLFAADPQIEKPIEMNFDARGRLWVATSTMYPQIKPGEVAHDQIFVLEDTNGDGRADKSTVFADNLQIPTGLAVGDGGVYVANSTELLFLKDTDGDGRADTRRVVLSGFGTEDTHHILHTLRFGPDGQLYMNQSIYIHSAIETPWGLRTLGGSGTWRFRPRSMRLEDFTRGLVNPWGHTWDYWGQDFATDGAGGDGVTIYYPDSAHGSWGTDTKRWMDGLNPGSPKYCGAEIIQSSHFPDDWQGSLVTADFRANRLVRFKIAPEGSGFTAALMPDIIRSKDRSFRPVDMKMGPDGALYIADWYNPIINHGEVDFRDPRRDHSHGRIWRLVAKNRPLLKRPDFNRPTPEVVEMLKSPEGYVRHMAKRVLYERNPEEVASALKAFVNKLDPSAARDQHALVEALWAYETIDDVQPGFLARLLSNPNPQVRQAAVRASYFWAPRLPNLLQLLAPRVIDQDPKVRIEAIFAIGQVHTLQAVDLAFKALQMPRDRYIDYALFVIASRLQDVWFPAVQRQQFTFDGNVKALATALSAVDSGQALAPLMNLFKAGKIGHEGIDDLLEVMSEYGTPGDLASLWQQARDSGDDALHARVLAALAKAARRGVRPAGDLQPIAKLFTSPDPSMRASAARLAGLWKLKNLSAPIANLARAADSPNRVRLAAVEALGRIGGEPNQQLLRSFAAPPNASDLRVAAIVSLQRDDPAMAATLAAPLFAGTTPFDPSPIVSAFLARPDGAATLAKALSGVKVPPDTAKLSLRAVYATGRAEPALSDIFRKAASIGESITSLSPSQLATLVAEVKQKGDAARGQLVFRSTTTSCYSCHAIGGAGGWLGPDLSSVGSASPMEYLVESVLLPNKAIKDGYEGVGITTRDSDYVAGIRVSQSPSTIILKDATRDRIVIRLKDIRKRRDIGSLMPSGLADLLTHQEFLDLVKFLSALGTPGEYQATDPTIVRRWRTPMSMGDDVAALDNAGIERFLHTADPAYWIPVYSTVQGPLPLSDVPSAPGTGISLLSCDVDVSTPGNVRLDLDSADGLTLFVDGRRHPIAGDLHLAPGRHTLAFRIDRAARRAPRLRLAIAESLQSPAKFVVVTGK